MSKKLLLVFFFFLHIFLFPYLSHAATYTIDQSHSSFNFAVKHLMVSTVTGGFKSFTGTMEFDPNDLSKFKTNVTIQVDSIFTQLTERDNHLKSADFFDSKNFPTMTFVSQETAKTESGYTITGNLTIRGTTKRVIIPVTINGPIKGMDGKDVIGLSGECEINRQDYGVSWNKIADNGAIAGNMIKINVNLEAHAQ